MWQVRTCGITWKNARIYKICHRSGPVNILRKNLFLNIKSATGSGPAELCEKMLEFIKCATGPDLWIIWEKTFIFNYQKCDKVRTCGIMWKNARIYKMYHRSGPVNILRKKLLFLNIKSATGPDPVKLCEKMLEYIKCTTGPDLWIFWEKTFIFKYQKCDRSGPVELREKMLEYIKYATGPDLWIFWEKNFYF